MSSDITRSHISSFLVHVCFSCSSFAPPPELAMGGIDDLDAIIGSVRDTIDSCPALVAASAATVPDPRLQRSKAASTIDVKDEAPKTPPDDDEQAEPPAKKIRAATPLPPEGGGMIRAAAGKAAPLVAASSVAPGAPPGAPPVAASVAASSVAPPVAAGSVAPPVAASVPRVPPRPPIGAPPASAIALAAPRVVPPKLAPYTLPPWRQGVPVPKVIAPPKWLGDQQAAKASAPREKRPRGGGANSAWHSAWHKAKREGADAEALFLHFCC
jgi:hypothetical protein